MSDRTKLVLVLAFLAGLFTCVWLNMHRVSHYVKDGMCQIVFCCILLTINSIFNPNTQKYLDGLLVIPLSGALLLLSRFCFFQASDWP